MLETSVSASLRSTTAIIASSYAILRWAIEDEALACDTRSSERKRRVVNAQLWHMLRQAKAGLYNSWCPETISVVDGRQVTNDCVRPCSCLCSCAWGNAGLSLTGGIGRCNEQLHRGHIVVQIHMYPSCIVRRHAGNIQNVPGFGVTSWIHFECHMYPACIQHVTLQHMADIFGL